MRVLSLWYGLPGAGKSTQLRDLEAAGWRVFDDFMKHAARPARTFAASRHAGDIVAALHRGEPCAIADIRLCRQSLRTDVATALGTLFPALALQWNAFDCRTPDAVTRCRANVLYRSGRAAQGRWHALAWIALHRSEFTVEPGARIFPVTDARLAASDDGPTELAAGIPAAGTHPPVPG